MIKLYFGIKIMIPVIAISILLLWIAIELVKTWINKKTKQNCFECDNYKLHSVASVGDHCKYKCELKNRIDNHGMNDRMNFIKCNDFRKETK